MKKLVWVLLGLVVLLFLVYLGGSWYFSSILIDMETQSLDESVERMATVGVDGRSLPEPESVSIQNGDITLEGWYYENPAAGDCAVMLLHGYTGTRVEVLQYAPLFWERGCHLLAYDARGHGSSSDAYHTYGFYEKEDGIAAFDWLMNKTDLSPEQVGLAGVSYGAATALQMAPLIEDAAFILADSAYQDLETIVSFQSVDLFGNWVRPLVPAAFVLAELRTGMDVDAISPRNAVVGVDIPILLVHSREDAFTSFVNSEGIYANANPETAVLQLNDWGAPHGQDILTRPDEYAAFVDEFLAEFVPQWGMGGGR